MDYYEDYDVNNLLDLENLEIVELDEVREDVFEHDPAAFEDWFDPDCELNHFLLSTCL